MPRLSVTGTRHTPHALADGSNAVSGAQALRRHEGHRSLPHSCVDRSQRKGHRVRQCPRERLGDVRVVAARGCREMNVEFIRHGDHSSHALHRLFGGDELPIVGDVPGQGDCAVVCGDTDVRSLNARIPAQLDCDEILQGRVCCLPFVASETRLMTPRHCDGNRTVRNGRWSPPHLPRVTNPRDTRGGRGRRGVPPPQSRAQRSGERPGHDERRRQVFVEQVGRDRPCHAE